MKSNLTKKKHIPKLILFPLLFLLILILTFLILYGSYANKLTFQSNRYTKYSQEISSNKQNIISLDESIVELEYEQESLEEQLEIVKTQGDNNNKDIKSKEEEISQLNSDLANAIVIRGQALANYQRLVDTAEMLDFPMNPTISDEDLIASSWSQYEMRKGIVTSLEKDLDTKEIELQELKNKLSENSLESITNIIDNISIELIESDEKLLDLKDDLKTLNTKLETEENISQKLSNYLQKLF